VDTSTIKRGDETTSIFCIDNENESAIVNATFEGSPEALLGVITKFFGVSDDNIFKGESSKIFKLELMF
jgi:hypothetical protein